MYETRIKKIFDFLTTDYDFHTADEMAMFLELSAKTIRNEIKKLNEIFENSGAYINSIPKKGYVFTVENHLKFENFLKNDWHRFAFESENFNNRDFRINYILEYMLYANDYVKSEILIDTLLTSASLFAQDLKSVKKIISSYGLSIQSRPHYGIKIQGTEISKRQCMSCELPRYKDISTMLIKEDFKKFDRLKEIVTKILIKNKYEISSISFNNLLIHLYIAIKRIEQNSIIQLDEDMLAKLREKEEYTIARQMSEHIGKECNIEFPDIEVAYILTHIIGKQSMEEIKPCMLQEAKDLINEMLLYVKQNMNYDFTQDNELISSLTLHVIPLIERINYGLFLKNPIIDDIKSEIMAYEVASVSSVVINDKYKTNIKQDEIGYLALHFSVALLRRSANKKKKNILIICGSGKGSANLMKYSFLEEFSNYVSNLKTCGYIEAQNIDLQEYDLIISAIKTKLSTKKDVIYVDNLLKKEDFINIRNKLEKYDEFEMSDLFDEKLFFSDFEAKDRNDAIKKLSDSIIKYKNISTELFNQVIKREELSSTQFDNFIAMPHPMISMSKDTFITIAILKKPILWSSKEIKLIIFLNISDTEKEEKLRVFYSKLANFMSSTSQISSALKSKDVHSFVKILNQE